MGQSLTGGGQVSDKGKEWQMELLMEKLRSKASTFKPLVETAKNMRMAMLVSNFYLFLSFLDLSGYKYNFLMYRTSDSQLTA